MTSPRGWNDRNEGYKIYDFIQMGSKALARMQVTHSVENSKDSPALLMIYSEMADPVTRRVKDRTVLLLPTPVASVILYSLKNYSQNN